MIEIFLSFLTMHLVGDFVFQNKRLLNLRNKAPFLGNLIHSLIYSTSMFLAAFCYYNSWLSIIIALALGLSHFLIDFIKIKFLQKHENCNSLLMFIIDQLAHVLLLIIPAVFQRSTSDFGLFFFSKIPSIMNINLPVFNILVFLVSIISLSQFSGVFIEKVLETIFSKEKEEPITSGKFIGIFERLIIYICSLFGYPEAIMVVITAKTIARYNRFKSDEGKGAQFAEKYLVGTLLSVLISILFVGLHHLV